MGNTFGSLGGLEGVSDRPIALHYPFSDEEKMNSSKGVGGQVRLVGVQNYPNNNNDRSNRFGSIDSNNAHNPHHLPV